MERSTRDATHSPPIARATAAALIMRCRMGFAVLRLISFTLLASAALPAAAAPLSPEVPVRLDPARQRPSPPIVLVPRPPEAPLDWPVSAPSLEQSPLFVPTGHAFLQSREEFLLSRQLQYPIRQTDIETDETGNGDAQSPPDFQTKPRPRPPTSRRLTIGELFAVSQRGRSSSSTPPIRRLLQSPVPPLSSACEVTSQFDSYTAADWDRWDGWNPSYNFASRNANFLDKTLAYRKLVQHILSVRPFAAWMAYYRNDLASRNLINELTGRNSFQPSDAQLNVSATISIAYNALRCQRIQAIAAALRASSPGRTELQYEANAIAQFGLEPIQFDALPGVRGAIDWLESYLQTYLSTQQLADHSTALMNGRTPFDTYGMFATANQFGSGFDLRSHCFNVAAVSRLAQHYLHFFSTPFLRTLRAAARGWMTGLHTMNQIGVPGQHSTAQWMLDCESWANSAYILKQSEAQLRARGAWLASDESTVTQQTLGDWRTRDVFAYAESRLAEIQTRTQLYGMTEYRSDYYYTTSISLGAIIQHAGSAKLYNSAAAMWSSVFSDLLLQFTPSSGSFSAPSARTADLIAGTHSGLDRFDIPFLIAPMIAPACAAIWSRQLQSDPTLQIGQSSTCPKGVPVMLDPSGSEVLDVAKLTFVTYQLAGRADLLWSLFQARCLQMPRRIAQHRFSDVVGQERYNYVHPAYALGHAGETAWHTNNNVLTARLGGLVRSGGAISQRWGNQLSWNLNYIRFLCDINDRPFARVNGAIAGDLQIRARTLVTQYQHMQLITQLLAPQVDMDVALTEQLPWSTNLFVPLAVDGIFADDTQLPDVIGTAWAIPSSSILTVQHRGACFGARLLYAETSPASSIQDATVIAEAVTLGADPVGWEPEGAGQQPYLLMWQVHSESRYAGDGRFVLHHKHRGVPGCRPFQVVWLWAATEVCSTVAERQAFQQRLRSATFTQTMTPEGTWEPDRQPWTGPPPPFPSSWRDPVGSRLWRADAQMDGRTLTVIRRDIYRPWRHAPIYSVPTHGPLHSAPYIMADFSRQVDGVEQMTWVAGSAAESAWTGA